MTDDVDSPVDKNIEAAPGEPACGERLAEARRAQRITVLEIAKELHLDEPKVRALESNDFEVLGAPVFAKGHMRKYAQLVGVDIDDVMADYYRLTRASGMPPVVQERQRIKPEMSPGPWIAAIILLLAAILAYWMIGLREIPVAVESDDSEAQESALPEPVQQELPVDDTVDTVVRIAAGNSPSSIIDDSGDLAVDEPTPITPRVTATDRPVQIANGELQMRLELNFSGECWTEISDADGRRLFFGMGNDGRSVELSGKPPFSVLLGDAQNVTLLVNGDEYTIPATSLRGRTARLMLQPAES